MKYISLSSNYSGIKYNYVLNEINTLNIDCLNMIKNYDEIAINSSFLGTNILNKINNLNVICVINCNDYKVYVSPNNLKFASISDKQSHTLEMITNNIISKNVDGNDFILSKLDNIYNNYSYFIENNLTFINFKKVMIFLEICIIYDNDDNNNYINKLSKHLIVSIKNNDLTKNDILEIFNYLKDTSNEIQCEYWFGIVLCNLVEKIKNIEFEDSLVNELLTMTFVVFTQKNYKYYIKNLYNLLKIDNEINQYVKHQDISMFNDQLKSKELYNSILTRTDWVDELKYGNIMGILLSIDPKEINRAAYNLDYIPINDITHTIIGFDQILEAYSNMKSDMGTVDYSNVLSGFGIGNGNCILPIYINKEHWKFVKLYMYNNFGIIFNRNSLDYCFNHKTIYKNVLVSMINLTFSNSNNRSDKWINLLFSVLRTNYELFKYDHKSKNYENSELSKFINDIKFRTNCNLNTILVEYLIFDTPDNIIYYIFEELIRQVFKSIYKTINILDDVYDFEILSALNYEDNYNNSIDYNINYDKVSNWIKELEDNNIFSEKITLIYGIIMMKKIISKNNFFDTFDKNCGILPDDILNNLKNMINTHKIEATNSKLIGLINPKFSEHSNFTKTKVFSIDTFLDLNLVESRQSLMNIFIQGLIQRVNKCRTKAINNKRYQDPYKENNIINFTGLLISQRFIKTKFNLNTDMNNYINTLNTIEINLIDKFVNVMIKKTITIKKYILDNINKINTEESRRNIVINMISNII